MTLLPTLLVTILLAAPTTTPTDELWVGQSFMPRIGVKLTSGGNRPVPPYPDLPLVVNRVVLDNWLDVRQGFIQKTEVVSLDEALAYFTDHIEKNPDSSEAYSKRAVVWKTKGEPIKALEDADKALQLDPKRMEVYLLRADIYLENGDKAAAKANYTETVERAATGVQRFIGLGLMEVKLGDDAEAIKHFSSVLVIAPN